VWYISHTRFHEKYGSLQRLRTAVKSVNLNFWPSKAHQRVALDK
jgi:hypothetical protein